MYSINLQSSIAYYYQIFYFILQENKMQNATPEQIQKAFRLCDMLGMEDVTIAFSILEDLNWNIEKALQVMQDTSKSQPTIPKEENALPENYADEPIDYGDLQSDHQNDEYAYDPQQETKNKKQTFNEAFEEIKLDRSSTQPPNKLEKRLSFDRHVIQDFSRYRHAYQLQLLEDSQKFCRKLLGEDSEKLKKIDKSKIRNDINRNFICYLSKNYRCSINFTFGTFLLNLVRSYLDKKYLLVYIHQMEFEDSRSLRMLLSHKETTKFINSNFISYGMFDNCDDYDIIQKYVPMKQLPAFALFKYSKKTKKQKFLGSYQVLQKEQNNFMEWLANNTGISIHKKKKQIKNQNKMQSSTQKQENIYTHRDIMSKQNEQYEEMQRIYKLRRQESQIKKDQLQNTRKAIEKMKEKFKEVIKMEDGKTIQIKFRLPNTGKSITRVFRIDSPVKDMFDFVNCFGREQFEQKYANFDLTQTFPRLSLHDEQKKTIRQIFQGSSHENIIVKEL